MGSQCLVLVLAMKEVVISPAVLTTAPFLTGVETVDWAKLRTLTMGFAPSTPSCYLIKLSFILKLFLACFGFISHKVELAGHLVTITVLQTGTLKPL